MAIWCTSLTERSRSPTPSNLVGREQHAADGQVQAHADGVGRHQHVGRTLRQKRSACWRHLGRQRAVDDAHRGCSAEIWSRSINTSRRLKATTASPASRWVMGNRPASAAPAVCARRRGARPSRRKAAAGARWPAPRGRGNDDQLARRHADDGLRPGPAARVVEQHLGLVDDRHVQHVTRS